jgi:hypothetical protein
MVLGLRGSIEMLDSTGTGRIEYEDVLRALGYFIDQNNLSEICIVELREGILVRGISKTVNRSGFQAMSESFLFTNEDIERIVNEAHARRQQVQPQQEQKRGLFGR